MGKPDDFDKHINEAKMNLQNRPRSRVGIVGTGRFAAALTNRLLLSGYDLTIGSRQPDMRNFLVDQCLCNFNITSIAECVQRSEIVVLAIHAESYKDTLSPYKSLFAGKTLVDVSNRLSSSKEESYAEYLSSLLPSSRVVKAFNIIPAKEMECYDSRDNIRVFLAGNDMDAKHDVSRLAVNMGFQPVDLGPLKAARFIENYNLRMFPEWRGAAFVSVGVFNVWLVYVVLMIFAEKRTESWNQLFLKVVNKPICLTAITLMALAQIPRPLGAMARSIVGGKRKAPRWFQRWNDSQSKIGVFSWILTAMHVIVSVLLTNKTYFPALYEQLGNGRCNVTDSVQIRVSDWMNWKGEAGLLLGLLGVVCFSVVGFATIPSVKRSLSWRERRFTQSTLSYAALVLTACHVVMIAVADWSSNVVWPFYHSTSFLCVILPTAAVLVGILAACPCVAKSMKKKKSDPHFFDVSVTCPCPADVKGKLIIPTDSEITIYQERQRLSDRVGYRALVEEE